MSGLPWLSCAWRSFRGFPSRCRSYRTISAFSWLARRLLTDALRIPTPAMWTHFESVHIDMLPTYQSMYFPGQGLLLAAGQILFGRPWFALLAMDGLMCAALCWMLQAWLPRRWALLGGILAVLRLGLFSVWINTYHRAALLSAFGGALVLGSLPRLTKTGRFRYGLLMGVGIAILALTRPYEGVLLCLPVAVVLGRWIVKGKNRPRLGILALRAVAPTAGDCGNVGVAGILRLSGFWKSAHAPLHDQPADLCNRTLLHMAASATRAGLPASRHARVLHIRVRTVREDTFPGRVSALDGGEGCIHGAVFYGICASTSALYDPASFSGSAHPLPGGVRGGSGGRNGDRNLPSSLLFGGLYCGPLCDWIADDAPPPGVEVRKESCGSGVGAVHDRCLRGDGRSFEWPPIRFTGPPEWPTGGWDISWFGPQHFGTERAEIEARLKQLPGDQLVIVRYWGNHHIYDEWVYNRPDIDGSKVVWARDMGYRDNLELIHYYRDRTVWLVEPDAVPARITPYPKPEAASGK